MLRGAATFSLTRTQTIECASAVASAIPITMAAWCSQRNTGAAQTILSVSFSAAAAGQSFSFQMGISSAVPPRIFATVTNGAASATANSLLAVGTNSSAYVHGAAVFTSATRRQSFMNGLPGAAETTNITPASTPDRTNVSCYYRGGVRVQPASGFVMDAAIWTAALTPGEIFALANGYVRPAQIRSGNLVAYLPLVASFRDHAKGNIFVPGGTTAAPLIVGGAAPVPRLSALLLDTGPGTAPIVSGVSNLALLGVG